MYPAQRKAEVSAKLDELGVRFSVRESLAVLEARLEEALDLDLDEDSLDEQEYDGFVVEQQDIPDEAAAASYQDQIDQSECFGVSFYDEAGECPEHGCVLRDACRRLSETNSASGTEALEEDAVEVINEPEEVVQSAPVKGSRLFGSRKRTRARKRKRIRRGPDRKRHVHSEMEIPMETNGGSLYWTFYGGAHSRHDFHIKSEYVNVTRKGDPNKKAFRLFRLFPKKRALHIYVNEDFSKGLKANGFEIRGLSQSRQRFFTPHVGYVTIKSESRLRDFVSEAELFYGSLEQ